MGLSQVKDENIGIYAHTNKQFYISGECVEGTVYLNARKISQYNNIILQFQGVEHVMTGQGVQRMQQKFQNTYKSYYNYSLLVDFNGVLNQGHYAFPFALMLPNMMCGSFQYSPDCYIKYILRVKLVHATEQRKTQIFQIYLNIIQPPRMPLDAASIMKVHHSTCCRCCLDYGQISINLNSDKNFVVTGDKILLYGSINNTKGKARIKNWRITLEERRIIIVSSHKVCNFLDEFDVLVRNGGVVQIGQNNQFCFEVTIPKNIYSYTAIGRITARFFVLHLTTDYGCSTKTAQATLHIILHSKSPKLIQNKIMNPPINWAPQVFPQIFIQNMKPYVYLPLPQIKFRNQPNNFALTQTNSQTRLRMMMQPYPISINNQRNLSHSKKQQKKKQYQPYLKRKSQKKKNDNILYKNQFLKQYNDYQTQIILNLYNQLSKNLTKQLRFILQPLWQIILFPLKLFFLFYTYLFYLYF